MGGEHQALPTESDNMYGYKNVTNEAGTKKNIYHTKMVVMKKEHVVTYFDNEKGGKKV